MPSASRRLDAIPPYLFAEIARIKREAIASGMDILDLGIGDPDRPTPAPIVAELARSAEDPATHRYDESARGWPNFLRAATEWYARRFGPRLDPATEALQLIGSKEGLAHLAWAFLDPGDVAIAPNPGYGVYKLNSLMAGAAVHETPLREENAYLPRLDEIPSEVARRAKLFYVCYPHNPTGAVATEGFYRDAVAFCRENDILLVSDMAYATVGYDGWRNPTALQLEGAKEVTIEFHSLSKMFNMTGWRLGFALGNAGAIAALSSLKNNLDSKQFGAISEAGAYALDHEENADTLALYSVRRDRFVAGLNAIGWPVESPKGAFYVWARVPDSAMTSAEFCGELLRRTGIVAIPGNGYGSEGEGYLRFSLTLAGDVAGERFDEAVRRIAASGLVRAPVSA